MAEPPKRKTRYTWKEVCQKTGISKSTIVRWEEKEYVPRPKRLASNKARIWTDEILQKIIDFRDREEEPPSKPVPGKKR